jgi:hypothetical protein
MAKPTCRGRARCCISRSASLRSSVIYNRLRVGCYPPWIGISKNRVLNLSQQFGCHHPSSNNQSKTSCVRPKTLHFFAIWMLGIVSILDVNICHQSSGRNLLGCSLNLGISCESEPYQFLAILSARTLGFLRGFNLSISQEFRCLHFRRIFDQKHTFIWRISGLAFSALTVCL